MSQRAYEEYMKVKWEMHDDTSAVHVREILENYFAGMELRDRDAGVEIYARWFRVVMEAKKEGLIVDNWGKKKEE